jgi:hypothetical protein
MSYLQEKYPQKPWPKDQIWSFKSSPKVFGSPMLDAVLNKSPLDREMVHWLKHRPTVYQAMWDRWGLSPDWVKLQGGLLIRQQQLVSVLEWSLHFSSQLPLLAWELGHHSKTSFPQLLSPHSCVQFFLLFNLSSLWFCNSLFGSKAFIFPSASSKEEKRRESFPSNPAVCVISYPSSYVLAILM